MYSLGYRLIVCAYKPTLDRPTMNLYTNTLYVIAIGLQIGPIFYLETDIIMRSNMGLRSYAAFSCYNFALLDFNETWHMRCLLSNIW